MIPRRNVLVGLSKEPARITRVQPHIWRELTRMNNVHSTHRTAGVIENPFLFRVHIGTGHRLFQLLDDVIDHGAGVIAMITDSTLGDLMQLFLVKDVELIQTRVKVAVKRGEKRQQGGQEAKGPHGEAGAAGLGGLLTGGGGGGGGFGGHFERGNRRKRTKKGGRKKDLGKKKSIHGFVDLPFLALSGMSLSAQPIIPLSSSFPAVYSQSAILFNQQIEFAVLEDMQMLYDLRYGCHGNVSPIAHSRCYS